MKDKDIEELQEYMYGLAQKLGATAHKVFDIKPGNLYLGGTRPNNVDLYECLDVLSDGEETTIVSKGKNKIYLPEDCCVLVFDNNQDKGK